MLAKELKIGPETILKYRMGARRKTLSMAMYLAQGKPGELAIRMAEGLESGYLSYDFVQKMILKGMGGRFTPFIDIVGVDLSGLFFD